MPKASERVAGPSAGNAQEEEEEEGASRDLRERFEALHRERTKAPTTATRESGLIRRRYVAPHGFEGGRSDNDEDADGVLLGVRRR